MIAEFLRAATASCPWHLRRMGYLAEAVGLEARYRRCRAAWQPHLDACRAVILDAAGRVPRRRRALVLGAGSLYDVPVAGLAGLFDEVVLADIVVLRGALRPDCPVSNVRRVAADVTGVVEALWRTAPGAALPTPAAPDFAGWEADLIVSPNLLFQLPVRPRAFLERQGRDAETIDAFARALSAAHLDGLRGSGATAVLITEVEHLLVAPDGSVVERDVPLAGFDLAMGGREWMWDIAPRPEAHPDYDYRFRVRASVL